MFVIVATPELDTWITCLFCLNFLLCYRDFVMQLIVSLAPFWTKFISYFNYPTECCQCLPTLCTFTSPPPSPILPSHHYYYHHHHLYSQRLFSNTESLLYSFFFFLSLGYYMRSLLPLRSDFFIFQIQTIPTTSLSRHYITNV